LNKINQIKSKFNLIIHFSYYSLNIFEYKNKKREAGILFFIYLSKIKALRNLFFKLLDVILDEVVTFTFLTPIGDNSTTATNDFSGFAFFVDFAQTRPFAQFLVVIDLNTK